MNANDIDLLARLLLLPIVLAVDPFALLLVFGICLRMGWVTDPVLAGPAFAGFAEPVFLCAAAILYVLHALAAKIPPIGHLFDLIGMVAKPLAAVFLGLWISHKISVGPPLSLYVLAALIIGVPATFGLQAAKAKGRLALNIGTFGLLHPVSSTLENATGLLIAVAFALHPVIGLFVALSVGFSIVWLAHKAARGLAKGARVAKTRFSAHG